MTNRHSGSSEHIFPFIGRQTELEQIEQAINQIMTGQLRICFVSGDAGTGKSRLLTEIKTRFQKPNCIFYSGICLDNGEPYYAVSKILEEITGEQIIVPAEFVKFEEIFIINDAGIMIYHYNESEEKRIDEDILSGMLTAVQNFISTSFGDTLESEPAPGKIEYRGTSVIIVPGEKTYIAGVLKGEEHVDMRRDLKSTIIKFENIYESILQSWDGDRSRFENIEEIIAPITKKYYPTWRYTEDIKLIEARRLALFEKIVTIIKQETSRNGLILAIDDLHNSDDATILLLDYLIKTQSDLRLLFVFTYRERELKPFQEIFIKKLFGLENVNSLNLEPFKKSETAELVKKFSGVSEIPEYVLENIHLLTAGNPFYLVGYLTLTGSYLRKKMFDSIATVHDRALRTVEELIGKMLDELTEEQFIILQHCAILGTLFSVEILVNCLNMGAPEILDNISILESKALIKRVEDNENLYQFMNILIREAIYNDTSKRYQRMIHRKVGQTIETLYSTTIDDHLFELAYHFSNCRDFEKWYYYSFLCGSRARSIYALSESINYYESALEALNGLPESVVKLKKIELLKELAATCYDFGDWSKSEKYYEQLEYYSRLIAASNIECFAKIGLGKIYIVYNRWDIAKKILEKALDIAKNNNDVYSISEANRLLGSIARQSGAFDNAIKYYNYALENAQQIQDINITLQVYMGLGNIAFSKNDYETAEKYYRSILDYENRGENPYIIARAYNNLGALYHRKKEPQKALEYYEKCITLSRKIGYSQFLAYGLSNASEIYSEKKMYDKALNYCAEALKIFDYLGEKSQIALVYEHLGIIMSEKGLDADAERYFNRARELFNELNVPYYEGHVYVEYGKFLKKTGDLTRAIECFEKARLLLEKFKAEKDIEIIDYELAELRKRITK